MGLPELRTRRLLFRTPLLWGLLLGLSLFAAVQVARRLDHDPEAALRGAAERFGSRFREVERLAETDGYSIDEGSEEMLLDWWKQAKQATPTHPKFQR